MKFYLVKGWQGGLINIMLGFNLMICFKVRPSIFFCNEFEPGKL
jgi:hypothetical protein